MRNPIEASRLIEKLNGKMYKGAVIKVKRWDEWDGRLWEMRW